MTYTNWQSMLWVIAKFIAAVLWTAIRVCLIISTAIILGGFRGAARSKTRSTTA